jgi:dephospho-CoA kinase
MVILGLTGSIGMGKTTAAVLLRHDRIPVYDADAAVHALLKRGGAAVPAVAAAFPCVVRDGAVDRRALGAAVFDDAPALARLEAIVHPLVERCMRRFLAHAAHGRAPLVVLDIPLLFETGGERFCDAVIVVSAPAFLQSARVLARPGMTPAKLRGILERQMPDPEKRRRADQVVPTGLGRRLTLERLRAIVATARRNAGRAWRPAPRRNRRRTRA